MKMKRDKKALVLEAATMVARASELLEEASEKAIKEKSFDEANSLLCLSLDAIKFSNRIKSKEGKTR